MKISYSWLKQFLDINLPPDEVASLLTNSGLEVENISTFESMKGGLKGLVIGEVKTCIKHPNADKLSLTTVDVGFGDPLNIVCGAPNVAAGQKVVVAMVGTTLHPATGEPFEIKKSKIRGELSEGMICAEDEIGLGASHSGIIVLPGDAKTGMKASEYFKVEEDTIFEIGLTPNRADAASHLGVARDLLAVLKNSSTTRSSMLDHHVHLPSVETFNADNNSFPIAVEVANVESCPRYSGITISGVEVKESPSWLRNKLKAIGVGPINNIVDITNYVLHECGQPLHAFDAGEIKGRKVIVRQAKEGEKFVTLDLIERKLLPNNLMICNSEDPMCIAGVFGGIKSGVSEKTKHVFLESACFSPASIRKTSKQHGLKTDASFRFERGTDPEITVYAMKRAAMLIREIAGGKISSEIVDLYPKPVKPANIQLQYSYLDAMVGEVIDRAVVVNILKSLGISVLSEQADGLLLSVPAYKTDVTRPIDVVEEILRIYGFNNISLPKQMHSSLSFSVKKDSEKIKDAVASYLSANGFYELMTNSLTRSKYVEMVRVNDAKPVKLLNALSQELDTMRQTLLFGGLEAIEYNRNRKHADLKFFEFGKTYFEKENYEEQNHLALFITGKKYEQTWNADKANTNFFFLKNFVQNAIIRAGIDMESLQSEKIEMDNLLARGLVFRSGKNAVATFGLVHAALIKPFDINNDVWFADFNWDNLLTAIPENVSGFKEISKFPQVRRDLSMMIDRQVSFSDIRKIAFSTEKILLKEIQLFDVYEGEKIDAGKKSYAMSFILLDENQTLTDKQIDKTMNRLMEAFEKQANAVIRKQ